MVGLILICERHSTHLDESIQACDGPELRLDAFELVWLEPHISVFLFVHLTDLDQVTWLNQRL